MKIDVIHEQSIHLIEIEGAEMKLLPSQATMSRLALETGFRPTEEFDAKKAFELVASWYEEVTDTH